MNVVKQLVLLLAAYYYPGYLLVILYRPGIMKGEEIHEKPIILY